MDYEWDIEGVTLEPPMEEYSVAAQVGLLLMCCRLQV